MKTKKLATIALMISLSTILAQFKLFSTVAFDSSPAYLLSLMMGPYAGSIVGIMGHLATAISSGFPLSIPIHLVLMVFMGVTQLVFAKIYRKFKFRKYFRFIYPTLGAWLLNVILPLICLRPILGTAIVFSFFWPLTLATLANLFLAFMVFKGLKNINRSIFKEGDNG